MTVFREKFPICEFGHFSEYTELKVGYRDDTPDPTRGIGSVVDAELPFCRVYPRPTAGTLEPRPAPLGESFKSSSY